MRRQANGTITPRGAWLLALLLPGVVTPGAAQDQAPPSWGSLTPGPHVVGVASFVARDSARTAPDGPRVVQITFWYPARPVANAPVAQYSDYVALGASERGQGTTRAEGTRAVSSFTEFLVGNGVPRSDVTRWLESPMRASFAAPRARGNHPVVLVAQGNGHAAYSQAVLAEYLASHGYLVATTPSPGRIGPAMQTEDDILPAAVAQAEDLALALRWLVRRGWGDSSRVAVVGHSFGARAALLLLHRSVASVLVSLDGGIANAQGRQWLDGSTIDPGRIRGFVVHLFQEGDTIVRPDFALLRQLTGTARILVRAEGLSHWHFTSFGTISGTFPTVAPGATDRVRARTAAHVVEFAACVLDAWARSAAAAPEACLHPGSGLSLVERLSALSPR